MIVEIGGGKGGLKEYLEHGRKKGRELHRDQLDQRIALLGDLNVFEIATSGQEGAGDRYDHITLSFSEHHVTDELLYAAATEFREHVLAAWPESERHRIAFYAEAHRPRILSYTNSETGERIERLTHIHIGLGKHDLATGASIEPMGYLGPTSDNLKYIDAWQESFNARNGLSSPKDNPKITPENAVDILARYSGHRPDAFGKFNSRKAALEVAIQKEVIAKGVTTWSGLGELLAQHGEVSKVREGQFGECYRVKLHGQIKAMRMQGVFFQRQFIERSTAEKIAVISERASVAYREQMLPRKQPKYVAETLREWRLFKARENRYLHTGSAFYKNIYKPADAAMRANLLDQLERKVHGVKGFSLDRGGENAPTRAGVQRMSVRDLDAIQQRSEMLLRIDSDVDVRTIQREESDGVGMRQANGERGYGVNSSRFSRSVISEEQSSSLPTDSPESGIQPSSVLARVHAELRERYELAADKDRYGEIRENIDCALLLNSLRHAHGLAPDRYLVVAAKDGTPRIQCGSRRLTPNDFLTVELGLAWRDAAMILRKVYEQQVGMKIVRAREGPLHSALWTAFKAEQLLGQASQMAQLEQFDAETKLLRAVLYQRLRDAEIQALDGKAGAARKSALSVTKLESVMAKALLSEQRREARRLLNPRQSEAWRLFLQAKAQAGDAKALWQLRKLDDSARSTDLHAIFGATLLPDGSDDAKNRRHRSRGSMVKNLQSLSHQVEINGDVTYLDSGRAILRDVGSRVAILDPKNDQVISAGLLLAREKFGNGLALTGDEEFQRRVVAVSVEQGIFVRFVDPQLEALRIQLSAERETERRSSVVQRAYVVKDEIDVEAIGEQVQSSEVQSSDGQLHLPQDEVQQSPDNERTVLVADLRKQGLEVREANDGKIFSGKVRQITDQFVVQRVGRQAVVIHETGNLSGQYSVGQDAHIQYIDGRGVDRNQRAGQLKKGKPGTER